MHLKSLTLKGFKSFASATTLKFEPGICAVVGPNGAGKTTLMRIASAEEFPSRGTAWIMGERIGRTDMRDLRSMIGMSSAALGNRIPEEEKVGDTQ